MNKKNRFSMLEVNSDQEKKSVEVDNTEKDSTHNIESTPVKQLKVIIKDEEFENNLKHHSLKIREKEIIMEKQVIESRILRIRREGWIKIILGTYILFLVAKKYIWGTESVKNLGNAQGELVITKTVLNTNDKILIVLILIFIYFTFFAKNQKDKK